MAPARKKTLREVDDDEDVSQLRQPITLHGKPVEQILNSIHYGSPELRNLLLYECDMIFECKVCRALFRDLPNFISHKRKYCSTSTAEKNHFDIGRMPEERMIVIQPEPVNKLGTTDNVQQESFLSSCVCPSLESSSQHVHDRPKGKTDHSDGVGKSKGSNTANFRNVFADFHPVLENCHGQTSPHQKVTNNSVTSSTDGARHSSPISKCTKSPPASSTPVLSFDNRKAVSVLSNLDSRSEDEQKLLLDSHSHDLISLPDQENLKGIKTDFDSSSVSRSLSPCVSQRSHQSSQDSLEEVDDSMGTCDEAESGCQPSDKSLDSRGGGGTLLSVAKVDDEDDVRMVAETESVGNGEVVIVDMDDAEPRVNGGGDSSGQPVRLRPRRKIKVPVRNAKAFEGRLKTSHAVGEDSLQKTLGDSVKKEKTCMTRVAKQQRVSSIHVKDTKDVCRIRNGMSWERFYNNQIPKVTKCIDLKRMVCLKCGNNANYLHNLRRHVMTQHMKVCRYQCKVCGLKAFNKADIHRHILRTHSEIKTTADWIISFFKE